VLAIRNGSNSLVVRASLTSPLLSNSRQDSPQRVRRLDVDVRGRVRSSLEVLVQRTGVARVEEDGRAGASRRIIVTDVVASLLANEVEDIGSDIEAAESVQIPIGFNGGDFGVVVVVVGVFGADERVGKSVAEHQGEDAVALGVGLGLVEGDQDKSAVPEAGLLVVDQRLEEVAAPLAGNGDGSVVSITCLRIVSMWV
jgi:hypothetical protein